MTRVQRAMVLILFGASLASCSDESCYERCDAYAIGIEYDSTQADPLAIIQGIETADPAQRCDANSLRPHVVCRPNGDGCGWSTRMEAEARVGTAESVVGANGSVSVDCGCRATTCE